MDDRIAGVVFDIGGVLAALDGMPSLAALLGVEPMATLLGQPLIVT